MRIILALVRKEFIQVFRDKRLLVIVFFVPLMQLILFGYVVSSDIKNLPMVVVDQDKSAFSRLVVRSFVNSKNFELAGYLNSDEEVIKSLDSNEAAIAVLIPPGFGDAVKSSRTAVMEIVLDGTDSNSANQAQTYATSIVNSISSRLVARKLNVSPAITANISRVTPDIRVLFNPDLKSVNYMVPGLIGLILTLVATLLTSVAIVKERERGTLEQLIVSPIKRYQLIAGKILPFVIIGFMDVILIVAAGKFWFGIPFQGSILLLLALCSIFLFAAIGQGLLASTTAKTQQQAMVTSWFFLFPSMLLSGFIFPIQNMPVAIQYVTYLIPLRYFLVIVRGIFLKGVGLEVLWKQVAALTALGIAIFFISVLRFRKKFTE